MEDRGGEASTSWQVFRQRTLHAAACDGAGDGLQHRTFAPVADLAAAAAEAPPAKPRKKKRQSASLRKLKAALDKASPEERRAFYAAAWAKRLEKYPEEARDATVRRLPRDVLDAREDEKVLASGRPLEPQINAEPRWRKRVDPYRIRPGATKMVLPPDEEAKLQLDQYGTGIQLSPKGPFGYRLGRVREDFVFGIFGRSDAARRVLEGRWAGRDPEAVMLDPAFYEDVLDNANRVELTLMAQTLRPLPLAPLRRALGERLGLAMRRAPLDGGDNPWRETPLQERPLDEADAAALDAFQATFDEKRLAASDPGQLWVDRKGNIKEGTHLVFNVSPDFELHGEVITPGTLRDRKAFVLGKWRSAALARAAFDLFLGDFPVDAAAKVQAAQAIVYVTNGFKLGPDPTNPNHFLLDTHGRAIDGLPSTQLGRQFAATPEGIEMAKPPPPSLADWALERLDSARPLLDGLRRRLPFQGQAQRQPA